MPTPGWYPDPAGTPGLFRYWNGQAWTADTTRNPSATPLPAQAPLPSVQQRTGTRGRRSWLIAIIAIVAVIAVIIGIVLATHNSSSDDVKPDTNSASPTGPQWNETSTPTPKPTAHQSSKACPYTTVTTTTRQSGNTLRGGGLQMDKVPGWTPDNSFYLPWMSDNHAVATQVYTGWEANAGVAALNAQDGFTDIRAAAQATLQCYASSDYYQGYTGEKILIDNEFSVDNHQAWRIQAEVYVNNPIIPQTRGDRVDIIVVDVGSQDHLGVFIGSSDLGNAALNSKVDNAISSLRVVG